MSSRTIAICLAALVVLSGCSALGGGDAGTPGPSTDGAPSTATSTPTAGPTPTPVPEGRIEAPLENVRTATLVHVRALQDAGSFTYRSTQSTYVESNPESGQSTSVTARIVVGEAARVVRNGSGVTQRSYAAPDASYAVRTDGDGSTYFADAITGTSGEQYLDPALLDVATDFTFERAGETVVGGADVVEYRATSLDKLAGDRSAENVSSFDVSVYVADSGIVRGIDYRLAVDHEGRTYVLERNTRVTAVGETDAPEPGWVGRARSALESRELGQPTTRRVASSEARARLTVTAPEGARTLRPLLVRSENTIYLGGSVQSARISRIVEVTLPRGTEEATLELENDGTEDAAIYRYDWEHQSYVRVGGSVADDSVSVPIERGGVYVVIDESAWDG